MDWEGRDSCMLHPPLCARMPHSCRACCACWACPDLRQSRQSVVVSIDADEQARHGGAHAIVQARQLSGVGDLAPGGRGRGQVDSIVERAAQCARGSVPQEGI